MPNEKSSTTPLSEASSELESEFADGIPSSVELPLRPQVETVGDKLKRLYPEHYVHIITEATRQNGPEHTARMLGYNADHYHCALATIFLWSRTKEGCDFWIELSQREQS